MRAVSFAIAALVCASVSAAINIDEGMNAKCLDWILSNQKDMIILNQVAGHSHIATCAQYCMIAGNGFRSDTTTCKLLCDNAGGYEKFSQSLNKDNGFAAPEEICKSILGNDVEVSLLQVEQMAVERKVGVRGDITIQGTLITSVLTSPIGDVKISGELNVMNAIQAESAKGAFIKANSGVSIKQSIVSTKDQLLIKGKIDADSVTSGGAIKYSFLEIDGVRQWALHSLEDFEEVGADGWSHGELTECGGHKILGGHCVEKATPELTKTFSGLPAHSQIRVVAKYLFIDSWDGESGYVKADGNTVWVESYNHANGDLKHGISICGNETPERKFSTPIDLTIPHTGDSLTLSFGATTDEHSCDESFGIDSVMIFTR
jgi:hypothetical protein